MQEYHRQRQALDDGGTESAAIIKAHAEDLPNTRSELQVAQAKVNRAESLGMEAVQQRNEEYQCYTMAEGIVENLKKAMISNAENMAEEYGQELQEQDVQWKT